MWDLIEKYFVDTPNYISSHHIESYNDFVRTKIHQVILETKIAVKRLDDRGQPKLDINVYIGGKDATKVWIAKPVTNVNGQIRPLFPAEARLKNLDYMTDIFADVVVSYSGPSMKIPKDIVLPKVCIGSVPIMVNSCLCVLSDQSAKNRRNFGDCPYDQGGYFIIGGLEKVLIGQERLVYNRSFITKDTDGGGYKNIIMCSNEKDPFVKTFEIHVKPNDAITLTIKDIDVPDIPLTLIFRALGVESDREIIEYIVGDIASPKNAELVRFMHPTLLMSMNIYTRDDALAYLKDFTRYKSPDHVTRILTNDFMRCEILDIRKKCIFFGLQVKELIEVKLGRVPTAHRDSFMHKRVDISGTLVSNVFRDHYNELRKDIRQKVELAHNLGKWTDVTDLVTAQTINASIIRSAFKKSMRGKWGVDNDDGIVQDLNRISYVGYLSHMRRLIAQLDKKSMKLLDPHRLHATQWGVTCPIQSPDGLNVGLSKHMSIMTIVSTDHPSDILRPLLVDLGCMIDDIGLASMSHHTIVLLNNTFFGLCSDPGSMVSGFKIKRRAGEVPFTCSIRWNRVAYKIYVASDSGRLMRPLLTVTGGKVDKPDTSKPWGKGGGIEYIDVEESNDVVVAMWPKDVGKHHTHCEIHPSTILSLYTNTIPFSHHNTSSKNVFSCSMGKQAVGVYATNFVNRMDTEAYILHYPQQPLVNTRYSKFTNNNFLPNGENVIVAVASCGGWNMEDGIILNRQSFERGMFNMTYYKSFVEQEADSDGKSVFAKTFFTNAYELERKSIDIKPKYANELTIDENGIPKLNSTISTGDALVGKVAVSVIDGYIDKSKIADKTIDGIVDKVLVFDDEQGQRNVKVRMRKMRQPELGDKMCLTPDHCVLTRKGWVNISDITLDHEVANLEGTYDHPTHVFQYECFGDDMYEVNTDEVKIKATLEHRMYVRTFGHEDFGLVPAHLIANQQVQWLTHRKTKVSATGFISHGYTGTVHCIRVPTHIMCVSNNGAAVWTGNSSRHGQKGVCGMILNAEDMPFTRQGMVPDIIINPHAFPTRMTIGHLYECIAAKAAVSTSKLYDSTVFENHDVSKIMQDLSDNGYERHGQEVMYSGTTGGQIECDMFIGPTYYYRLKHMVSDKINYRSSGGAVSNMTAQPVRGRAVDGGLRIGEMERDVILSTGATAYLKETFIEKSDGQLGQKDIVVPHAFTTLLHELGALGIGVNVDVSK